MANTCLDQYETQKSSTNKDLSINTIPYTAGDHIVENRTWL